MNCFKKSASVAYMFNWSGWVCFNFSCYELFKPCCDKLYVAMTYLEVSIMSPPSCILEFQLLIKIRNQCRFYCLLYLLLLFNGREWRIWAIKICLVHGFLQSYK